MMERVPNPEEALLLEEAWAQLLHCAATLHELHDFVMMLADTMRQREPGLAHQPPVVEAIDQFLQQRQALRMTPQGFVVQGADRGFYAGLAETFGVRADAARILMDEPDRTDVAWFQQLRQWVDEGMVWPAVGAALEFLDPEGQP